MKKIMYILLVSASFAACKGKNTDMQNKEMVNLSDPAYNSSYLTDTGAVANTDAYTGGNVVSGKATVPETPAPARKSSGGSYSSGSNSGTGSSSGTGTAAAPQKKGISKAAKGAIIGGVGGAVAGAVIGKNAKGAIIGGAVGAAGGYIIGRSKDKKDGRY
jgi:hypothetical protein